MKLVKRYDYAPSSTSKVEMTPEGFMLVEARASRVGVLKYKMEDGTIVRELVPAEELFKPESMNTLAMKPITNNHPKSLLDSESAGAHMVGMTGETVKNVADKYLDISTVITDATTIAEAEGGKVEVSPGYVCELEYTTGVFDGEEYDAIQRNRRYNHLAVVKKGRNGPEVRLRLDAADAIQVDLNQKEEGKTMKYKFDDGSELECSDAFGEKMKAEQEKKKKDEEAAKADAQKAMDAEKSKLEEAKKDAEKALAKADALEAEIKKMKVVKTDAEPTALREAVKARIALERVASAAGVEKFDDLSDIDLKKAVIKTDAPDAALDGKSDDYINARFDVAAESISVSDEAAKKLGGSINKGARAEVMDADVARQKMIERQQNAWKGEKKGA